MQKKLPLTLYEREKVEFYLKLKLSHRGIAKRLKRDRRIIGREIRRNSICGKYIAKKAQELADKRAIKTNKCKLDKDEELRKYVYDHLKEDWSPEEIAGRLKEYPPPEVNGETISHESIYQYIYNGNGKHWYHFLRKKNAPKRRKKKSRKPSKITIPKLISITERPPVINERKRYGDWESDLIIFTRQKPTVSVQHERKSLAIRMHKSKDKTANENKEAIIASVESLPNELFKSLTFDRGKENVCHVELKDQYDLDTYFCEPYKSWQKGGVENSNRLIRQYLPRRTDLDKLSDKDIYEIQERLNNRPRKKLNYLTPNEVINSEISRLGGALNP